MPTDYPPSVASLRMSSRWVYRELRKSPGGQLTKAELQSILGCDPSTVNRAVDDLVAAGAVETVVVPGDPQCQAVRLR